MEKRKIAMICANFGIGGGQKVVLDILKAVDKKRYQIKLFIYTEKPDNHYVRELDKLGIDTEFIKMSERVSAGNYRKLAKALGRYDPDVVHIHLDMFYAPLWAFFHRNVKYVFTLHSQPWRQYANPVIKSLHRLLAQKQFFQITGVSRQISKEIEELLKLEENIVTTVCNPVTLGEYPSRESKEIIRFINVARFSPVKNHRLLLEAFARMLSNHPQCVLWLAGDGEERDACEKYANLLGIGSKVEFLGNVRNVEHILKECDVFVISSDSEAMPISILEAMAQGLPIVATAVGGVPELIDENGILTEKGDVQAFCDAMGEMATDATKRRAYGYRSYELAKKYSVDRIVKEYEKLYG